MQIQTFDI